MIVVSGPYSSTDKEVKKARTKVIADVCVKIMTQGIFWYSEKKLIGASPLLSGLAILEKSEMVLPDSYEFWNDFCRSFIRGAEALFVVDIEGWETSSGVRGEIKVARECSVPVYLIDTNCSLVREILSHPMHKHDCDNCTFLGNFNEYDLYHCPQCGMPTLIARCGEKGEYSSGMAFGYKYREDLTNPMGEAWRRSKEKGLKVQEF